MAELAERAGLPTVVTNEALRRSGGHRLQDVLVCIRHGASLDEAREPAPPQRRVLAQIGAELARIGAGLPDERGRRAWVDGLAQAAAIGRSCRLDLDFERYRFPGFTVPEGETPFSYLYQPCARGLTAPLSAITKQAGLPEPCMSWTSSSAPTLAEFFLIVWDLMELRAARDHRPGGKCRRSIVAYCRGITKVDLIEHKLLFERFINEARTLPDIDIDFDVNRREEVIQYLRPLLARTTRPWSAPSSPTVPAPPCARWARRWASGAVDRVAKALDTRDASDVARDLALDGSFGWLFDELAWTWRAMVPSNRDGRRTDGGALVARQSDSSWNHRPRSVAFGSAALRADLRPMPRRAGTQATTTTAVQRVRLGAAARPRVLDQSVVSVTRAGSRSATPAACGSRPGGRGAVPVPGPRDNGTPGAASDRPACGWTRSQA